MTASRPISRAGRPRPRLPPTAASVWNSAGQCAVAAPSILRLEPGEIAAFRDAAADLGVTPRISPAPDGGGNLLFLDHPGEHCPMLDDATSACRIYHRRPQCCRDFPRQPGTGLRPVRLDGSGGVGINPVSYSRPRRHNPAAAIIAGDGFNQLRPLVVRPVDQARHCAASSYPAIPGKPASPAGYQAPNRCPAIRPSAPAAG